MFKVAEQYIHWKRYVTIDTIKYLKLYKAVSFSSKFDWLEINV